MRLPTLNPEHERHEDARAHHEDLYRGFLAGTMVQIPITPATRAKVQASESSNGRRFWTARGFRIRTKANSGNTLLAVWLEPQMTLEQARVYREERRAEIAARKEATA